MNRASSRKVRRIVLALAILVLGIVAGLLLWKHRTLAMLSEARIWLDSPALDMAPRQLDIELSLKHAVPAPSGRISQEFLEKNRGTKINPRFSSWTLTGPSWRISFSPTRAVSLPPENALSPSRFTDYMRILRRKRRTILELILLPPDRLRTYLTDAQLKVMDPDFQLGIYCFETRTTIGIVGRKTSSVWHIHVWDRDQTLHQLLTVVSDEPPDKQLATIKELLANYEPTFCAIGVGPCGL